MYSGFFYWFMNMSIIGGITGLFVLLLRRIRKIPPFVSYILWLIPLIRLWIPFSISSPFSLMNLLSDFAVKTVVVYEQSSGWPDLMASNSIQWAESYFPIVYKIEALADIFRIAAIVWAVAAAAVLIAVIFLYVLTKSELKDLKLYKDNIYFSDKIMSPAVFGILPGKSKRTGLYRRRIILPVGTGEGDIPYVLMHESIHIKRRDNLLRMAAIVTACIHWFNPLVWLFVKYFFEDMELSCDAAVLKQCGEAHKKAYAQAIMNCAAKQVVFSSAFGGAKTKVRIQRILSYRRLTVFSSVCLVVLIAAVMVVLLTNGCI